MVASIYDLRAFYECRRGRVLHPLLQQKILNLWPDANGQRIVGCGYAVPFLTPYEATAERVIAVMPARLGVLGWPQNGENRACLSDESELPLETESVDKVIIMHGLEYTDDPASYMQEIWRILKSTGKVMIIVPNRRSLWCRVEWSPFGHGRPFSSHQLLQILRDNLFVIERSERALFLPAFRSSFLLRAFMAMESYGHFLFRGMAGLLVIEAGKQLYGGTLAHASAKSRTQGRKILIPSAAQGARLIHRDMLPL